MNARVGTAPSAGPGFFVVGAPKAGTTALCDALRAHPEIFVSPIKEPNHFCSDLNSQSVPATLHDRLPFDIDAYLDKQPRPPLQTAWIAERAAYLRLFEDAADVRVAGECSTTYLFSRDAAARIRDYCPAAHIIAILRDPVERAWSHHLMDQRIGIATGEFRDAIQAELEGVGGWTNCRCYLGFGRYGEQLARYYDCFPPEQILPLRHDQLAHAPAEFMETVCRFLGVAPVPAALSVQQRNVARRTRFPTLNRWLHVSGLRRRLRVMVPAALKRRVAGVWFGSAPEAVMDPDLRASLRAWFSADVSLAARLTGLDLDDWLAKTPVAKPGS